jgi:hypothetical protein
MFACIRTSACGMYACVHACVCMYAGMHACACVCVYAHACMYVCIRACVSCVCMRACVICSLSCRFRYVCGCMFARVYVCMYACMHVCVRRWVCLHACVCYVHVCMCIAVLRSLLLDSCSGSSCFIPASIRLRLLPLQSCFDPAPLLLCAEGYRESMNQPLPTSLLKILKLRSGRGK